MWWKINVPREWVSESVRRFSYMTTSSHTNVLTKINLNRQRLSTLMDIFASFIFIQIHFFGYSKILKLFNFLLKNKKIFFVHEQIVSVPIASSFLCFHFLTFSVWWKIKRCLPAWIIHTNILFALYVSFDMTKSNEID